MRLPLLGELEAAVMAQLWAHGAGDVKAVYRAVGAKRGITSNTVQSTMERLWRKGLLIRNKVSHAYVYAPRVSKEQFGADVVAEVVAQVLGGKTEPMLAAFVDLAARAGKGELERLEQLVAERRARKNGGRS